MLPPGARLRRSRDFSLVVGRGRRAGGRTLVIHALRHGAGGPGSPRVGFVVGRSVGGAVQRNVVRRRLRHVLAARLDVIPPADVVVRAMPASRDASSAQLAHEVDRALGRVLAPWGGSPGRVVAGS